jgi:putative hydrolase of the HAD superfamily
MLDAVLLDAMGTLIELEDPTAPLQDELRDRCGLDLPADVCARALRVEMGFYRAHHDEGASELGLRRLRRRCAAVLRDALGPQALELELDDVERALLAALRFRAWPDAERALIALRASGLRLVVVSNWDRSLHGVLARLGLARRLDAVVTSAEVGAAKPQREIFMHALAAAGDVAPAAAVHVGDRLDEDVAGARAAGLRAVLLARGGGVVGVPRDVDVVGSLGELVALLS